MADESRIIRLDGNGHIAFTKDLPDGTTVKATLRMPENFTQDVDIYLPDVSTALGDADGSKWHSGVGSPGVNLGTIDDFYIDTATADVYQYAPGGWLFKLNIRGSLGPQGIQGVRGAQMFAGSTLPSFAQGNPGDLYVWGTTGDVYVKVSDHWELSGANIRGPQGTQGTQGIQGNIGPQGNTGEQGRNGVATITSVGGGSIQLWNAYNNTTGELQFKTLEVGGNLSLTEANGKIILQTSTSVGEVNTLAAVSGSQGITLAAGKQGTALTLRGLRQGPGITLTDVGVDVIISGFSGNYADLTGAPTLFDGRYDSLTGAPAFAAVATSGSYLSLSNKPDIPTRTSQLTNDAGYVDSTTAPVLSVNKKTGSVSLRLSDMSDYSGTAATNRVLKFNGIGWSPANVAATEVTGLAAVARTGSYNDLADKPTSFSGSWDQITGKPTFATVSMTGSYTDLINKPTIPTKTSQLTNDSGFALTTALPTKLTQLTNDQAFITQAQAPVQSVNGQTGAANLGIANLKDVVITAPTAAQVLKFDGTNWTNAAEIGAVTNATNLKGNYTPNNSVGVFKQLNAGALEFYSLRSNQDGVTLALNNDTNEISFGFNPNLINIGSFGGTLPTNRGGTGRTSWTAGYGRLVTSDGGTFASLDGPTASGQVLSYDGQYVRWSAPTGAVASVNGKTGTVVLAAADISGFASVATTGAYADLTGKPTIPAPTTTLAALTGDVSISSPSNGQSLVYNSSTGKWSNSSVAGGSGITSVSQDTAPALGGNLNLAGYKLSSATGTVTLENTGSSGQVVISSTSGNVQIKYGSTQAITVSSSGVGIGVTGSNYLLPTARPTAGQVLRATSTTVTGWGNIAWSDVTGKPTFATVATTGAYTDLSGLPTLFDGKYSSLTGAPALFSGNYADLVGKPALFSGAYADLTGAPALATVATSGSYVDLINKPTLFSGSYNDLSNLPTLFDGDYAKLTNKPTLFSGAYADLTGKPALFSGNYVDLVGKPTLFSGAYADLTGKPVLFSGNYSDLVGKPTLATVATTGSYNDLKDKPTAGGITADDAIVLALIFGG